MSEYDELLESFMNNSAKVYSDDKDINAQKKEKDKENIPAAYNVSQEHSAKPGKSLKRGRKLDKKNKKVSKKKSKNSGETTKGKKIAFNLLRALIGFLLVVLVVGVVCFSVIAIYGYSVVHGDAVFDLTEEANAQNQTSFLYGYDDDGNTVEITRLHGEENRIWVDIDDMSEYMEYAFIAIEDERFYSHHGVDWIRTIGVIVVSSNWGQGGSTITQQLIKNLTDDNDVTIVRKFNEILYALNIEKNFSKEEIIEAYLNTIYLSEGCYGVKTAAEEYFGKDVSDLNIAECACIAAITQQPYKYDPLLHPDTNRERQLYVLEKMLENGFITEDEYNDAVDYEMVFTNSSNYTGSQVSSDDSESSSNVIDSWYVDYVITTVIEDLQKQGYTYKKAKSLVYGGGLKIYCAIDFDVQEALEEVYENYQRMPDETVQGAMVVMNYEGRVLGLVGGTGEKTAALVYNRATQAQRQPGSAIKPLSVYGPALEKSLNDDSVDIYWSTYLSDTPLMTIDGEKWPTNEGGTYSGKKVTLQYGLSKSMNTISAQTLNLIGIDYSYEYITEKFHISTMSVYDKDWAPLATGSLTTGVTVLEMTAAYATFGNGGEYYYPYCYYKIEDSQGNVIIETDAESTKEEALSESTAWVMNKLLQTVMTSGTGTSYKLSGIECFGKTGTTTGSVDRWFVGGTPEYVAAVWYGYDIQQEIVYTLSSNPSGTIWKTVMTGIYDRKGTNKTTFDESDEIVRKAYASDGKLAKYSSGTYGWYAVDNLPSYSTVTTTAATTETTTAESTTKETQATTAETKKAAETTGDGNGED
ncbi:MAG: transglycosylase domain-containing protein [Clostridiales bacterium]|nr:transglycosylase domain-containing protein [Clostridiales bacterium]